MNKQKQLLAGLALLTVASWTVMAPAQVIQAKTVFADAGGQYQAAVSALTKQNVLSGYTDSSFKPAKNITRAELAKMVVLGLGLNQDHREVRLEDVKPDAWAYNYAASAVQAGVLSLQNGSFHPNGLVTRDELAKAVAHAAQLDVSAVAALLNQTEKGNPHATRGEAAQVVYQVQQIVAEQGVRVTSIKALNPITLEVIFSEPLAKEDVDLAQAKKNFSFDNGLALLNIPQLKTGSKSTYIVPTTPQKPGTTYTLTYKGKQAGTFAANETKLALRSTQQVSYDTFEVESRLEDGITDYGNIVQAYSGKRNGLDFILDENNQYNGVTYQIISSMRDKQVYITPEGGEPIVAGYVPFTQNTDGRQAPKFRLPNGATFQPGVTYTVTSDWATIANPTFVAADIAPLELESVKQVNLTTLDITLKEDPQDELFAFRSVSLTAADGSKLTAQYKVTTRKGATGTFEIQNGGKLVPGTSYTVEPVGKWAVANNITLTATE